MKTYEEEFPDVTSTYEEMLADMHTISDYYSRMGIENRVVDSVKGVNLPLVVAIIDNEMDEVEAPRVVTNAMMPVEAEVADVTKYLQYYSELDMRDTSLGRMDLLELANLCNLRSQGPHLAVGERDGNTFLGLRFVQGFPLEEEISPNGFVDGLSIFDTYYGMVELFLGQLEQGKTLEQAREALGI